MAASAVNDMIHLLAELIENATLFSPSATKVEVRAERVANGFAIEVEDRGLGIAPDQLGDLNARLASPPDFDLVDADRLGLFVAGLLAARHGVEVVAHPVALPRHQGDRAAAGRARAARPAARRPRGRRGPAARHRSPARLRWSGWLPASPALAARPRQAEAPRRPTREAATHPSTACRSRVRPDKAAQPAEHGGPPGPGRDAAAPSEAPAPDDARRLAASLQRSWHRSRAEDDSQSGTGAPDGTRRLQRWAPDEEECYGW